MPSYDREFLSALSCRLREYLEMTGRSTTKNFPCASPDHEDKNPSMHFYGTSCYCFSCGARYDLFKMIGADFNIQDFRGQVRKACEIFNVRESDVESMLGEVRAREEERRQHGKKETKQGLRDFSRLYAYCRSRIKDTDYWEKRGFSVGIVGRAGLGFHPKFKVSADGETWPSLIIPVDKHHFVVRNTAPDADKNHRFHASSGGREIYTKFSDVVNSRNPTWIVEGEIDAISIADAGGEAIALGSTQNVSKLLRYLSDHKPKSSLILALDFDAMGQKAQKELTSGLDAIGVKYFSSRASGYKDANEFLQRDREGLCQYIHRTNLSAVLSESFSR